MEKKNQDFTASLPADIDPRLLNIWRQEEAHIKILQALFDAVFPLEEVQKKTPEKEM